MKVAYLHRKTFEESEARFIEEAKKLGIELVLIKYKNLSLYSQKGNWSIKYKDTDLKDFDAWYFRAVGSELEWAKLLELYAKEHNILVVDDYLINEGPLRRFKSVMGVMLHANNINYPKTLYVAKFEQLEKELLNWELPVIVKLSKGGRHGMGTFSIKSITDLNELKQTLDSRKQLAVEEGRTVSVFKDFLVQEFIPNDGDYRVMTVGYKCIGGFKRKPKEEKLVLNKSQGKSENLEHVPLEVSKVAQDSAKILGVEVAGTDLVKHAKTGEIFVIEVNEAPQFKVFEKRTSINVPKLVLEYISDKIKE